MSASVPSRGNDLGHDPITRLLVKLSLPAIAAQLVNALYNIVDRIYIGHIKDVGDLALTGLGVCFPIIMFISALAALICVGGGARAAIRMGGGDLDGANAILGNCTATLVLVSVAAVAVFQSLREPLLLLFGASEGTTLGFASDYLFIYLWGTLAVQCSLGLNYFISTQGFSTISMLTVVIGAVANIILDPIFIFALRMGVQGAALATILSQSISAVWVLCFLLGHRSRLRIQARFLRIRANILLPVLAIGVSPFIMQSTESLVSIALNSSMKRYGGDVYVGAMTIGSSIMQVLFMPMSGLTQGAQPIIGFNYGAGQLDRVKQTVRLLLKACLFVSCLGFLLVELFPGVFIAVFNDKPELVETAVWLVHIYFAGLFMLGIQSACQQTFVALGQAKVSLFLALLRKVVLLIPLVYLLPQLLSDRVFAVVLAEPVADILAALTTGTVFFFRFPKILAGRAQQGPTAEEPGA